MGLRPYDKRATCPCVALHFPAQRLVKAGPELEVLSGIDAKVAIEIEGWHVVRVVVERAAEDQVVGGADGRLEIDARGAAGWRRRRVDVAEEPVERRGRARDHVFDRLAKRMDLGGVDLEVVDAV